MQYNVFICYRGNEGAVLASNIYSDLLLYTSNRLKVFFAPRCVGHGENFKHACLQTAAQVPLMILILSGGFFDKCSEPDDIVFGELKAALANEDTKFLPIIMPGFDFKDYGLETLFDETEIDRIKHISAIKFTDVYSFSSTDMLIPILKDKVGVSAYLDDETGSVPPDNSVRRLHIGAIGKDNFFTDTNTTEKKRLALQQHLLMKFDMPAYEKILNGKHDLTVLDIGCGNGAALMSRLGNRCEVKKIIGIEYDRASVDNANITYSGTNASFYCLDAESDSFRDDLKKIMEENEIEAFDLVNMLAVMAHLKSPYKVLRAIHSYCKEGAQILIRNIDDGLNICYPDDNRHFERMLAMLAKCETTGYRRSGREVYTLLRRSGYRNIRLERNGLNTIGMSYADRCAFFEIVFRFVQQGIEKAAANHPSNAQLAADKIWLHEHEDDLEEAFMSDDFFLSFGFLLFTAEV